MDADARTGSAAATAAAADHGVYGLRLANAAGQATLEAKTLPQTVDDSSTRFSFRTTATSGFVAVAEARDSASSGHMWTLLYDAGSHGFLFYPYTASGSVAIDTGAGSAPGPNTWIDLEVRYDAASGGAAQLLIDGQTQASWGTTADLTHSDGYRILQLWNDGSGVTSDFDDVTVAARPAGTSAPGAPTAVTGTAGDGSVALYWTAPASDGGSPVTGYRITPFVGGTAQTAVDTGLDEHVAHDHGPHERHRLHVQGRRDERGRHRSRLDAERGADAARSPDRSRRPDRRRRHRGQRVRRAHWTAPAYDGNSAITGYRITPFIGTAAQTPVDTGTTGTSRTITGLTNGTAYTFKVAATNSVGTGAQSAASDPVTPAAPAVPGAPGRPTGAAGGQERRAHLDRARDRRRQRDHELPDHALRRRHRPDADRHGLDEHVTHDHRAHRRHGLHVHGRGDQRRRDRAGVARQRRGDAAGGEDDRLHRVRRRHRDAVPDARDAAGPRHARDLLRQQRAHDRRHRVADELAAAAPDRRGGQRDRRALLGPRRPHHALDRRPAARDLRRPDEHPEPRAAAADGLRLPLRRVRAEQRPGDGHSSAATRPRARSAASSRTSARRAARSPSRSRRRTRS